MFFTIKINQLNYSISLIVKKCFYNRNVVILSFNSSAYFMFDLYNYSSVFIEINLVLLFLVFVIVFIFLLIYFDLYCKQLVLDLHLYSINIKEAEILILIKL